MQKTEPTLGEPAPRAAAGADSPIGPSTAAPPRWSGADATWAAVLAGLAIAVRALPWRRVLEDERVVWHGNDAYYHARRIIWSLAHYPDVLERDPYLNHPYGGEPIWTPAFDFAAATLAWAAGLADDPRATERLLVWIPPALGAATVVLAAGLARRADGRLAGVLAGLFVALVPAHFAATRVGFLDHHGAVSLATTALLAGTVAVLARRQPPVWGVLALGLGLGGALLLWPGMLLQVTLVELGLLAWLLSEGRARRARRRALALAGAQLAALAVVAPFSVGRVWERWGDFSPVVLSGFQPWAFGVAAAGFALYAGVARGGETLTRARRACALAAALGGAILATLPFLSGLPEAARTALEWLGRQEAFQAQVAESLPLFVRAGRMELGFAYQHLTGLVFLAPLWLAVGLARARGSRCAAAWRFGAGYAAALLVATLAQTRFAASLAPTMAVLVGVLGAAALRRGRGTAVTTAVLGLVLALPALGVYGSLLRDQTALLRGEPPALGGWAQRHRLLLDLAGFLRESTPEPAAWLDPDARPSYGVLSHWADGHVLEYVGRRPTVVTNFGDDVGAENLPLSLAYYRAPETQASAILERVGARYVVFEYRHMPSRRDLEPHSMLGRLYFGDGGETESAVYVRGGRAALHPGVYPAISRHRLVYETDAKPNAPEPARPGFKVYEHVRGAELVGNAEPGARVEARLELATPRGRRFTWRASVRADASGRYRMRVPYATQGAPPAVRPGPTYRLRAGSREGEVAVPEAAVLSGQPVASPDLRDPRAPEGET